MTAKEFLRKELGNDLPDSLGNKIANLMEKYKMKKEIFKVGDRVFHIMFGWGKITDVDDSYLYVEFKCTAAFHKDGRLFKDDKTPTLSFTEYTLQGFNQVKEPEIGSLCLFSDNEDRLNSNINCVTGILDGILKDTAYKYSLSNGSSYKYCKQIKIEEV